MKNTFEFTELERSELYDWLLDDADIKHIEQIVSERITPEQDTIKPYHEHGNSVASDRTESGQSAEDVLKGLLNRGMYEFSYSANECLQAMHTYASHVCAYKDARITEQAAELRFRHDRIGELNFEIDRLNESLAVMVRKNAELQDQIERFKNPLKAK